MLTTDQLKNTDAYKKYVSPKREVEQLTQAKP